MMVTLDGDVKNDSYIFRTIITVTQGFEKTDNYRNADCYIFDPMSMQQHFNPSGYWEKSMLKKCEDDGNFNLQNYTDDGNWF